MLVTTTATAFYNRRNGTRAENIHLPKHLVSCTIIVIFFLFFFSSVIFFMYYQNLNFIDSYYMMFITATTIGYGDISMEYYSNGLVFFFVFFVLDVPFTLFLAIFGELFEQIKK